MRLDVNALGTFYRMAREGAGLAAGRLTRMTGVETRVGVTKLNFVRGREIRREFDDGREKVGVRVGLSGAIEGRSVVVFERESSMRIVDALSAELAGSTPVEDMHESATTEVGHIMNSGFVDGWADVLESVIDVSTPEFVAGTDAGPFLGADDAPVEDDLALLFQSRIDAVGTEIGFRHYLFPERASMRRLLDRLRTGEGIEYDKLEGFDRMAERGAAEIARTATQLTGLDASVEIRRLNFLSLEAIPQQLPDEPLVGIAFEFDGVPSGYLLFVFDEASAAEISTAMIPAAGGAESPDGAFGDLERSAIKELGNVMASGLLDGWANVLDTTIDHSPPEFVHDIGPAVIDPVVVGLGDDQEYAFVFDTVVTADGREIDCEVYAIPEESALERALNDLDVDRVEEAPTTAAFEDVEAER